MNNIKQLQTTINTQEHEATKLDHSVTTGDYYKNLYTLLSVAYFASKDINAILLANIPIEEDITSNSAQKASDDRVAVLEVSLEVANKQYTKIHQQLAVLKSNILEAFEAI